MKKFLWPQGTEDSLVVYSDDHPQRKPTEEYFANIVRRVISDIRFGTLDSLNLLIDSLRNLTDSEINSGFDTWLWAFKGVLGSETCKKIGEAVCSEMNFTIEEGENVLNQVRIRSAIKLELNENASWEEIQEERNRRDNKEDH